VPTLKNNILIAAGLGGGFAVILAAVAGTWVWYEVRPHKDPGWNSTAIKATFKDVVITTSTPNWKLTFSYILENTTNSDYSIDGASQVIMATLPGGKGFEPDETLSLPSSFYIPAKQKVVLSVFHALSSSERRQFLSNWDPDFKGLSRQGQDQVIELLQQKAKEGEYTDVFSERDKDGRNFSSSSYMNLRLRELDGFVVFDKTRRYKIVLPNGWLDASKK
jgi:hypothetical protein